MTYIQDTNTLLQWSPNVTHTHTLLVVCLTPATIEWNSLVTWLRQAGILFWLSWWWHRLPFCTGTLCLGSNPDSANSLLTSQQPLKIKPAPLMGWSRQSGPQKLPTGATGSKLKIKKIYMCSLRSWRSSLLLPSEWHSVLCLADLSTCGHILPIDSSTW